MDLHVKNVAVDDLIPYINNARTHSDEQVTQLAASIREFGFNSPILIDKDNTVIAGHGRLMAAKRLGMDEVPTIKLDHLTEAQRKAYILADNRLALNAGWDNQLLALELEALQENGMDVDMLGFSETELKQLLNPIADEDVAMPDVEDSDQFLVVVDCKNETTQKDLYEELSIRGFTCKLMM